MSDIFESNSSSVGLVLYCPPVSWRLPAGGATCEFCLLPIVIELALSLIEISHSSDKIDSNSSRVELLHLRKLKLALLIWFLLVEGFLVTIGQ